MVEFGVASKDMKHFESGVCVMSEEVGTFDPTVEF